MSGSFALKSASKAAAQTRAVPSQFGKGWKRSFSASQMREAIMMPSMSPFMTEGTIKRWNKKEGEAFQAGDVILQIESDIATIDVEAQCPGILGKILMPDGSSNVAVEQVIALVARTPEELAALQSSMARGAPPPLSMSSLTGNTIQSPFSPRPTDSYRPLLFSPRTPRTPSLFELQNMGIGQRIHDGGMMSARTFSTNRTSHVDAVVHPSPTPNVDSPKSLLSEVPQNSDNQLDGPAIRRMIVSNLSRNSLSDAQDDFHDLL